jgi:hypothetical protein
MEKKTAPKTTTRKSTKKTKTTEPRVPERRQRRSPYKDISLQHWLDAVASRRRVDAIVVANDKGLLVGGGVHGVEADEIAGLAAEKGPRKATSGYSVIDHDGERMTIKCVSWKRQLIYVAAKGDPERSKEAITESIAGIDRILTGI